MGDYSELKRLVEAATPGPWEFREADGLAAIAHAHGWVLEGTDEQDALDKQFIAAANPAAVLALIAENERLERKNSNQAATISEYQNQSTYSESNGFLRIERDHLKEQNEKARSFLAEVSRTSGDKWAVMAARNLLKAENEALRKDAEWYRFLRNSDDDIDFSSAESMEEIDALIDAAMSKGGRP